ncbi:uncharacterized protein [Aegilops tauschii subsp. strangulata]|uniref:uncharacterized protein n=1 Tax=Aegilops tauschii subsp. strangulata TaxID=200361 RepID=UPI001ABC7303|nr:uncharacterized protein LOC109732061 [Aegilops tauschii subsp. strangulata]
MTSRRHRSPSPAALDDDDLLFEILLHLPPQPSSLPRASLVNKRWRRLASDPGFLHRFRIHHRRSAPILGCFVERAHGISFEPTLEAPNRVPPGRFSLRFEEGDRFGLLDCRHDLVLVHNQTRCKFLVWDPITGEQHHLAIPAGFDSETNEISGAVLRAGGDVQHFEVVFVRYDDIRHGQAAVACVYSSEMSLWSDLISTPLPWLSPFDNTISTAHPAVLAGDALYWFVTAGSDEILEFDLWKHKLAVIQLPVHVYEEHFTFRRTDSGVLGFLHVSSLTAQLWQRKTDCEGVASWELGRTIELDKLLSMNSENRWYSMICFAQDNNVVFLLTVVGLFAVQLQTLEFKKLPQTNIGSYCLPFESVYNADIGGEHGGADLFHNA